MRSSPQAAVIHVVYGDESARSSLVSFLRADGYEVESHADAKALLQVGIPSSLCACVVTELVMPAGVGTALIGMLNRRLSPVPVIALIDQASLPLAVASVKAGAFDVLDRSTPPETVLHAIEAALAELDQAVRGERDTARRRLSALTSRERDVLQGLIAGKINRMIGQELGISPRTVEVYRAHIMSKARVGSLSDLIRLAMAADMTPSL